ncbi:hypothetical protein [Enterobacter cloacae]|uniref:hypothetical protein n=1 Tax=Enterobacter cloacae TaxID=550 RepID=UPI001D0748C6|nr:hypothetical protein [Enterobacter cloacae]MDX7665721.1 hypothetical protein [Enterobacter cloacae]
MQVTAGGTVTEPRRRIPRQRNVCTNIERIYITEYAEPDTTTGDVYRYFLASKFDGDPLEGLEKQHIAPTLTANTPRAKVDGIGNNISFTVHGTVYDFTTSAFFYDAEGIAVAPSVDLTARGEGWDKGKFNK